MNYCERHNVSDFCPTCNPLERESRNPMGRTYLRSKAHEIFRGYIVPLVVGSVIGGLLGVLLWALQNQLTPGGV